jgi:hypothetical protein
MYMTSDSDVQELNFGALIIMVIVSVSQNGIVEV